MIKNRFFLASTVLALGLSFLPVQAQTASMNQPKTPFSAQISSTGSGIAGVYRLNGPTQNGPFFGLYAANSSATALTTSTQTTLGGWAGIRTLISKSTYFNYGVEAYTNTGKERPLFAQPPRQKHPPVQK